MTPLNVDLIHSFFFSPGINLTEPTKTQLDSLFDVFASFANPSIMHRPILRTFPMDSVSESIRNAFEDSVTFCNIVR